MSKTNAPKPTAVAPAETGQNFKPKFVFQDYTDNTGPVDKSRIDELVTDDFSHDVWQAAWIRYDMQDKALRRYYQKVQMDTHGHLFKPEAFDEQHNCIGRGYDFMAPTMGGIPEVYLYIRPREAADEEQRQMAAASARRLQENQKMRELREKTGGVVGADVLGGVSTSRSGWGD